MRSLIFSAAAVLGLTAFGIKTTNPGLRTLGLKLTAVGATLTLLSLFTNIQIFPS